MRELLIATTNAGKLREIRRILEGVPISVKSLADLPSLPVAAETGTSFSENATQKALHYAGLAGLATVAEDSGLEVDALDREPGIYSARYLREDATYDERFADIYRRLRERGARDPTARFVCALVVAEGSRIVFEATASVEGLIADAAAGSSGFGYDPIFLYPPYGRTFGEASEAEKTAVSHRGQAVRALRDYLVAGSW